MNVAKAFSNASTLSISLFLVTNFWGGILPAQDRSEIVRQTGSVDDYTNSIGMRFVRVPAGSFRFGARNKSVQDSLRGAEAFDLQDFPTYEVSIPVDFQIGCYEVTMEQYTQFVNDTGYLTYNEQTGTSAFGVCKEHDIILTWKTHGFDISPQHPVVNVTWQDAIAFCKWLSEKESKVYRLPTEVEWEYACRGGRDDTFSFGDDATNLFRHGNIADVSLEKWGATRNLSLSYRCSEGDDGYSYTAPVGKFVPNLFGIYDMHGNVEEWCSDVYTERDGNGNVLENSDNDHVVRGGSWYSTPFAATSTYRNFGYRDRATNTRGFRVVRIEQCSEVPN